MKTYNSSGTMITVPAPADIESDDFVIIGSLYGYAVDSVKAGGDLVIMTTGVFEPATLPATFTLIGTPVYSDGAGNLTDSADATTRVGTYVGYGKVRLV